MVRKTKCEAEITRGKIIDAAFDIFLERGFNRATLEDISRNAGLTRGAIYCHFRNKTELFVALTSGAFDPLRCAVKDALSTTNSSDPLDAIQNYLITLTKFLIEPSRPRKILEIIMRGEDISPLFEIKSELMGILDKELATLVTIYRKAAQHGTLSNNVTATNAALDTYVFSCGLLHLTWGNAMKTAAKDFTDMINGHMQVRRVATRLPALELGKKRGE